MHVHIIMSLKVSTPFVLLLLCFFWQQIYMYFRGTGKAAEMKREAARGALRAAI